MPSFEIPADIFTRLSVFDSPKGSSNTFKTRKKYQPVFQKKAPNNIHYLLTGCKGRTRKYKPKVFHTARACEGCLENQGLVFPGTSRAPS